MDRSDKDKDGDRDRDDNDDSDDSGRDCCSLFIVFVKRFHTSSSETVK